MLLGLLWVGLCKQIERLVVHCHYCGVDDGLPDVAVGYDGLVAQCA